MKRHLLLLSLFAATMLSVAENVETVVSPEGENNLTSLVTATGNGSVADRIVSLPEPKLETPYMDIHAGQAPSLQSMKRDSIVIDSVTGQKRVYKIPKHKIWKPFYMLYNYLNNTTRHEEKKFDGSFIVGPAYNANTSFAFGGGYTALYSFDRSDKTLQKSVMSLFFQFSVKGMAVIGVEGHNFMKHDKHRWNYELSLTHYPSAYWGGRDAEGNIIDGYEAAENNKPLEFKQFVFMLDGDFTWKLAKNLYIGPKLDFLYTNTFKYEKGEIEINGKTYDKEDLMKTYLTTPTGEVQPQSLATTGLGLSLTYDSRDFAMNAYRGHYFRLQHVYFVPGINKYSFWKTDIKYSNYTNLWTKCVMAFQVHGQFNYGSDFVPWTRLASTGFQGMGRGYFFGQYRDNNVMETQLELRQRIKWRLGVAAWVGMINVFHDFDHIYWKETLPNYGFGIRWEFKPRMNVRLDYGFTKHGGTFVFNFGEAF